MMRRLADGFLVGLAFVANLFVPVVLGATCIVDFILKLVGRKPFFATDWSKEKYTEL